MLDFYGFKKLLSQKNLWTTEKEHSTVIKRVEMASSSNLPMDIVNHVFPYGWKSCEFNYEKAIFCSKILQNNPFPSLPSQFLQDLSEEELRPYIEQLCNTLQNQFDECIENLYKLNRNDEEFTKIKEIFIKKFLKIIRIESLIGIFSIVLCIIAVIIMFTYPDIKYISLLILPLLITFFLLVFFGISMDKYFKVGTDKYPEL